MMLRALAVATVALSSATSPLAAPTDHRTTTEGTIFSVVIRPESERTDVMVGLSGEVTLNHFVLRSPDRIVVDISNARLAKPGTESTAGAPGSGINAITRSQFSPNVVRVVLRMETPRSYSVSKESQAIRISVTGRATSAATPATSSSMREAFVQSSPLPNTPTATATADLASSSSSPVQSKYAVPPNDYSNPFWRAGRPLPVNQSQSQQRKITINFDDQPIKEVLHTFADYSNRTIVSTKDVTGNVSISIKELPWDVALRTLLNAYGFDAREDPIYGTILVDTYANLKTETAAQPLVSATFRLNYSNPSAVAPALAARLSHDCPPLVSAGTPTVAATGAIGAAAPPAAAPVSQVVGTCPAKGSVSADSLTNSVSVLDVAANIANLEAYAKELDIRQPQVNIKAKIILVNRTSLEGLGIRYDLGSQNQFFNDIVPRQDSTGATIGGTGQVALGGNAISAIANATARIPSAALQLAYSTALGAFDFTAFIEALQTTSLLDVQAEPNGTTTNNRALRLVAGSQVPIRVVNAGSAAGTGSAARANVRLQQTGVILEVTPHVTNDRHVQMHVHVENSNVTFSGGDATEFPTQSVEAEMLVADGETRVIGGLTQTTVTSTRTGIPLLVDLPVLGRLFGVTQRQETKRDLLILITPYILDPITPPGRDR